MLSSVRSFLKSNLARPIAGMAALLLTASAASAQFTPGNVILLQAGDGTAGLTNAGTAVFLKEYNTSTAAQTAPVSSVAIPTTGAARLVTSGSATSEGFVTLSQDSLKLVVVGYDTTAGAAGVVSLSSALVARAIDTISYLQIPGRADTTHVQYSGNNIRTGTKGIGENYWGAGTGSTGFGGVYYFGNTAAPTATQVAVNNSRCILALNGNLYFTSSTAAAYGLSKITGQPTIAATSTNIIPATSSASPYQFSINPSETVAYLADDRASASGGGIQKWTYASSTWTLAYTLQVGASVGARGLAVDWSGPYPTLYATSTETLNRLVKLVDSNATAVYTTLATAATNTAFRGVALAPKIPCTAPTLSATATNISCTANGAITLTATGASSAVTYAWTGPSSFTSTSQNLTNLAAGTYNVTATTTVGGCVATASATITNAAVAPVATVTPAGPLAICQGLSTTLTANSGTGIFYKWRLNGSPIAAATSNTYAANAAGTYTVLDSTGINCVSTSNAVVVTVNSLPTLGITPTAAIAICAGTNTALTGTGATTYSWSPAATLSASTGTTVTATPTGTTTYTLTGTDANGCINTATKVVTVNPLPVVTPTITGATTFCTGGSVSICFPSTTGITYSWLNGATPFTNASNCYTATATGSYKVIATNTTTNCVATSTPVTVTVGSSPSATTTPAGPVVICAGSSVRLLTNNSTGLTYKWLLNGSVIPGATDSVYNATLAGTYTDSVSAGVGCISGSNAVVATITALPNAAVIASGATTFCAGNSVTFNGTPSTGNIYVWKNNGTVIAAATTASYTTNANGSYKVIVTNPSGCKDSSAAQTVVVNPLPVTTVTAGGSLTFCANDSVKLKAVAVATNTYQWLLNGGIIASATDSSLIVHTSGAYRVKVTTVNGCIDTSATQTITANPLPVTTVTASGPLTFCANDSVKLKAVSATGYVYQWLQNSGVITNSTDSALTVHTSGIYRVKIVTGAGCADTSAAKAVVVNPLPAPAITASGNAITTSTFSTYQWYLNGQPISGATAQQYTPTAAGDYSVAVTDGNSCSGLSPIYHASVGVKNTLAEQVKLYPNPAKNFVVIEAPVEVTVELKDLQGRVMPVSYDAHQLNISGLNNGIYFITIFTKDHQIIRTDRVMKTDF